LIIDDSYQILGVSPQASASEIRAAYRCMAKRCHPDMGGTHEQMLLIIAAWEVLSDPGKKAAHDEARISAAAAAQARWQSVREEASKSAAVAATEFGTSAKDFMAWVGRVSDEVEHNTARRGLVGALVGFVLGGSVGALAGAMLGVSGIGGSIVGGLTGAVGGFFAAKSRVAKPKGI
jgi:DnaJ-class molecular chaperone